MAKKRAPAKAKAKETPAVDKASAWALFFSLLSLLTVGVFMFCTQRELHQRPTFPQVLSGFDAVDKAMTELKNSKADK